MSKAKSKRCDMPLNDSHNHREDEAEGFVPGAILRITMTNFLTYNYAVLRPGPHLNMIIGANGTGKSSVVCAICLGLAGKTSVLGRGDKVGLYVKRGFSKGSIEIELYKPGGRLVITREIHVDNNQSLWMLNGKHCSQKAVEEEVKALQIQVSNLCQFLPQEKVGEFAKMSKIELLEATEKSVGPPEMFQYHCELKNCRNKEKELEHHVKEKSSFLEKLKQRNERNKHDVNRYYEKKRHLDLIELLEKKKPWVEYETSRKEFEDVQKELKEAKRQLAAVKLAQAPMLKKIQTIDCQLKSTETHLKEKAAAIKEASLNCKQKQDQLDRKNKQIEDVKQMLKLKQMEKEDHQKRICNTCLAIKDLKEELAKASDRPDVTPKINDINVELRRIQEEKAKIEGERSDLRREHINIVAECKSIKKKLMDMNNLMNAKEEKLRASHRDTHTALMWFRQNQNLFSGRVCEPMMLAINVRDQNFAKYVENYIPFRDLRSFVFQSKDDMKKFMTEVRDRMNLKVNSIAAPVDSYAQRPPSRSIESLRHFGFFSYLREMFDAPEEVMSYLCYQHNVHDVPVGNDQTKALIKTVIEQPYLRVLYTKEERYMVKRSHYSGKISTSNSTVQPSQYLFITVDTEEKWKLERLLKDCELKLQDTEERMKAMQGKAAALELQENKLLAEKKQLSEFKSKLRQLEQKIRTKQDSLQQMENSGIDLKKIEEEAKDTISSVISDKVIVVTVFMAQMKLRAKLTMEKANMALEMVALTTEKKKLQHDCREGSSELKNIEQKCHLLENQKMELREQSKILLARAKSVCHMSNQEPFPEELRSAFAKLPNTLDGIEANLNEERARAECFAGLNENVIEEFNRRDQEIKLLEEEVHEKSASLTAYKENISQVKDHWLIPLKQLIEQVNNKFSLFFRSMQCVGEVDLHSDNEEEYDKFGIRIRVKFHHSSQLHELTAQHQSGGERSVATMLYLMALQELNRCPFRVVDEINQGMDPVNERRVFDIVVRTACQESTSQYFFITPKLLQNLQYADEMTVHCVYNGTNMLPPGEWDEKGFLDHCRRRRATRRGLQEPDGSVVPHEQPAAQCIDNQGTDKKARPSPGPDLLGAVDMEIDRTQ
ncbi:structural maintenance of chromosomes protein 5, partial [Neosynchiropus ocellatus]